MQLRPLPRAFARLPSSPELSPAARTRLQALTVWQQTGDWRIASQVFDVSRATLYRWRRRYQPRDISSLEARSRRPHRVRRPQTPARILLRLRALRLQYPRWGREKLCILLRREGITLSAKTIDRAHMRLRTSGQLVEPPRQAISAHRRGRPRPYAIRKPRDYALVQPGDLVQVDTLDVRPLPGVVLKQFTARDVISRWDVVEMYRAPLVSRPRNFSSPCSAGCRSPFGPFKSMAAVSLLRLLNRPVSSTVFGSSSCPRARRNSTALSSAPIAPTPKSFMNPIPESWISRRYERHNGTGNTPTITSGLIRPSGI